VLGGGRVLVRYVGWSDVWDAPHRVTDLRLDPGDAPQGTDDGGVTPPAAAPAPRPVPSDLPPTASARGALARKKGYGVLAILVGFGLAALGLALTGPVGPECLILTAVGFVVVVTAIVTFNYRVYRCPRCSKQLSQDKEARYCPYCGL